MLKVVFLNSDDPGNAVLKEILAVRTDIQTAWDLPGLLDLLEGISYDIFLCDWNFQGGNWRDAWERVHERYPELPAMVVFRSGGEEEWVEVLAAGVSDLLSAPYGELGVLSALEHAITSYQAGFLRNHCTTVRT